MSKLFNGAPAMSGAVRIKQRDSCNSPFRYYPLVFLVGLSIFAQPVPAFASGTLSPALQNATAITQPTFNISVYTISVSTPGGACQWWNNEYGWTFKMTGEVVALSSNLWNCPRTRDGMTYDTYAGLATPAVCPAPSGGLPYVWNYKTGYCERPFVYPANSTFNGSSYTCNTGYQPDATGAYCVASAAACPANMSGSPCACLTGFVPNNSGSCDAEALTITLSGGTSTRPWHKKHDQNHEQANLPFTAIVTDQNGQAKANIDVSITSDVTSDSGGHVHTNGRPKGKLVAGTPASTLGGAATISGITDSSGAFSFTFGAEETSGEHKLTATCTGCAAPANATVNVLIPGLMLLDADPLGYELRGSTDGHPGNHYFSEAAIVKIINLAHGYKKKFGKFLQINDSSLSRGGVFDLAQNWAPIHKSHRRGIVVDINNYRVERDIGFERLALDNYGIAAKWEGLDVTPTPHYHLWLTGRDN